MKRAALLLIPVLSMLAVPAPAEARGKAYCRQFAEDEANRRANGSNVLVGTLFGAATGAIIGGAIGGGRGAGNGAIIGGVGGTVVGAAGTSDAWHRIYRNAYADCRAS